MVDLFGNGVDQSGTCRPCKDEQLVFAVFKSDAVFFEIVRLEQDAAFIFFEQILAAVATEDPLPKLLNGFDVAGVFHDQQNVVHITAVIQWHYLLLDELVEPD
ncbi:hypothetical protein D3C78_1353600 [compost metagenome]